MRIRVKKNIRGLCFATYLKTWSNIFNILQDPWLLTWSYSRDMEIWGGRWGDRSLVSATQQSCLVYQLGYENKCKGSQLLLPFLPINRHGEPLDGGQVLKQEPYLEDNSILHIFASLQYIKVPEWIYENDDLARKHYHMKPNMFIWRRKSTM